MILWETEAHPLLSTSLLWLSGLEGPSEQCRRILRLGLIYFIAGVPELLWWLQHIIWNFPPQQFFLFGSPLEREFGTLRDVVRAQLVQAQASHPRGCPASCSAKAPGSCRRAKPALLMASVWYPLHFLHFAFVLLH